jgi:hypothetical protein
MLENQTCGRAVSEGATILVGQATIGGADAAAIRMSIRFSRNPAKQTKWHQAMWRGGASTGIPSKPRQ